MHKSEIYLKVKNSAQKRRTKVLLGIIVGILAFAVLLRLFLLVFPVRHYELEGQTQYTLQDVINASGIMSGGSIYAQNLRQAEQELLRNCPYIKEADISIKFPSTICFKVEERVTGWYLTVGERYYGLDYDMRVVFEETRSASLKERSVTALTLPVLESAVVGELPKFGRGDEHLVRETLTIIDSFRTHDIKARLTSLDLSNRFEIKLVIDGAYEVNFGDIGNFETKLDFIAASIANMESGGYSAGQINVINSLAYSFRPIINPDAEDEKTETVE